jgi:hypothetical protein
MPVGVPPMTGITPFGMHDPAVLAHMWAVGFQAGQQQHFATTNFSGVASGPGAGDGTSAPRVHQEGALSAEEGKATSVGLDWAVITNLCYSANPTRVVTGVAPNKGSQNVASGCASEVREFERRRRRSKSRSGVEHRSRSRR